jgi:hypothetical protein
MRIVYGLVLGVGLGGWGLKGVWVSVRFLVVVARSGPSSLVLVRLASLLF